MFIVRAEPNNVEQRTPRPYTPEELQAAIGGYFEIIGVINTTGKHLMTAPFNDYAGGDSQFYVLVDEDGLQKNLPYNQIISKVMGVPIVGNAVVIPARFCR